MPRIEHIKEPDAVPDFEALKLGKASPTEVELDAAEKEGGPEAREALLKKFERATNLMRDARAGSPDMANSPSRPLDLAQSTVGAEGLERERVSPEELKRRIEEAVARLENKKKEVRELDELYKKESPDGSKGGA